MDDLTIESFADLTDRGFRLSLDGGVELHLELREVRSLGSPPPGRSPADRPWREPFSLLFQGPSEPLLPQRIYPLRHEELGGLELFLVPIGREQAGVQYQAIFA